MNWYQRLRRSGQEQPGRASARGGFSLVEVLVSLTVLAVSIVGVSSAGTTVVRQLGNARGDLHLWGAIQTVGDSLSQRGYNAVTAGSRSAGSYSLSWTVDRPIADRLDMVTLVGRSTGRVMVTDTVLLYLSNPNAP